MSALFSERKATRRDQSRSFAEKLFRRNMKTLSMFLILFIISIVGCQQRSAPAVTDAHWKPEIEWNDAQYSIEDYKRMQPHRPILAVFSSKWEPPPVILLKEKRFMEILREDQFLCLNYESTAPDSIGQVELKRQGYQSHHVFSSAFQIAGTVIIPSPTQRANCSPS